MCGIAGIWDPAAGDDELADVAGFATRAMAARGPDGSGAHLEPRDRIALAHTRLAIRDRSDASRQPVETACGRYVFVFNGEVYGAPVAADGGGDVAVLRRALTEVGPERAVAGIDGMFALAVWDRSERRLTLARDPFGEKPLYLWATGGAVLFASDPRALAGHRRWTGQLDDGAVRDLLLHGHVVGRRSVFAGVERVRPGEVVTVQREGRELRVHRSVPWDARSLVGLRPPVVATAAERPATDADADVRAALGEAVRRRLVADVPVGAALSGGIDSSLVCALARGHRPDLPTFTVRWSSPALDESGPAAAIARHLGLRNTPVDIDDAVLPDLVARVAAMAPEPHGDSSLVPTAALAEAARSEVGVLLTGDGGDELFGGYPHHLEAATVPGPEAAAMAARRWHWGADELGLPVDAPDGSPRRHRASWPAAAPGDLALWFDTATYLPDNNLAKTDAMTMGCGLEARSGFTSRAVAEAAWRLPLTAHVGATTKRVLRRILRDHLPAELVQVDKRGFQGPVWQWLDGPLGPWARDQLASPRLPALVPVGRSAIEARWARERGRGDGHWLWTILALVAWDEGRRPPVPPAPPTTRQPVWSAR